VYICRQKSTLLAKHNYQSMIHTELLKSEPPYQIIYACGQVGIQVATLIVTEETPKEDGSYGITTHSHPVVNYGDKDIRHENPTDESGRSLLNLRPEGAVWTDVEIKDIRVLGLLGVKQTIDDETFVSLFQTSPWDIFMSSKEEADSFYSQQFGLSWKMSDVGLSVKKVPEAFFEIEPSSGPEDEPCVLLVYDIVPLGLIPLRSIEECATILVKIIKGLCCNILIDSGKYNVEGPSDDGAKDYKELAAVVKKVKKMLASKR